MYLSELRIVNYKNFINEVFYFNKGSNTILGENDAGKTNGMEALRILLDNQYIYNIKNFSSEVFNDSIDNWRGEWIIISAKFNDISISDKLAEVCKELECVNDYDKENQDFLNNNIQCINNNYGRLNLYIRPNIKIRKKLFEAKDKEFDDIISGITINDYEFVYRARAGVDFNEDNYEKYIGNIKNRIVSNPDNDDDSIFGAKIDRNEILQFISVEYIDALRDVKNELQKYKNPLRNIVDTLDINKYEKDIIERIDNINNYISKIDAIEDVGIQIDEKLKSIVGLVYSPNICVESNLSNDIKKLYRYLTLNANGSKKIEELGLGHLNVLYIALKLLEFERLKKNQVLNIMIIEEPEAHIHTHIQHALFDNFKNLKEYNQVIMTTHSTHISEASHITSMNILKIKDKCSEVMHPTYKLDEYGKNCIKNIDELSLNIERYLDAKRSTLLFAKGVILVEGDAEEILLPYMFKKAFGITFDEIGISIINIRGIMFEYIAALFSKERIRRYCAIVTDMDIFVEGSKYSSKEAQKLGESRKEKLSKLFKDNEYVQSFYSKYTFEVDLYSIKENTNYIKKLVSNNYKQKNKIDELNTELDSNDIKIKYDAILNIFKKIGKGYGALQVASLIDKNIIIPDYIINAIVFASKKIVSKSIVYKILRYSNDNYKDEEKFTDEMIGKKVDEIIEKCNDNIKNIVLKWKENGVV